MEKVIKHPYLEWRHLDGDSGQVMPWYTEPCLKWLKSIDVSNWSVFEYGAGFSTFWWRMNAKKVYSVDTAKDWAMRTGAAFTDDRQTYLEYIKVTARLNEFYKTSDNPKFDCIIIDGSWRDECTQYALKYLKLGGYLIIDNYHQASVDLPESEWTKTDELLKDYPRVVFSQEGHPDWKTALWQIVK